MAQIERLEAVVQIKCNSARLSDFFKSNMTKLVDVFPQRFQSVELIEGEEGCAGNVKLIKYNLRGPQTVKMKMESADDGKRCVTFEAIEGEIMQLYKSFKAKVTVLDDNAKWSIEVEKANESCPQPDPYVVFATQITNAVDAYLVNF